MGQYFAAVVENKKGKRVFWPDGLKLVEHAYVEDAIARAVTWKPIPCSTKRRLPLLS